MLGYRGALCLVFCVSSLSVGAVLVRNGDKPCHRQVHRHHGLMRAFTFWREIIQVREYPSRHKHEEVRQDKHCDELDHQ